MASIGNLGDDVKIVQAVTIAAGAAGSSPVNGTAIDMSGYEGVLFVVQFGPIVSGAVTSIKVQQDVTSAMSTAADIAGTAQTVADTDDDKVFYVDLKRPREDFVRLVVSRGTQAATCAAMAYLYGSRQKPVTHGTNVAGEIHYAPAEGTA
jgi:hypothetical protein